LRLLAHQLLLAVSLIHWFDLGDLFPLRVLDGPDRVDNLALVLPFLRWTSREKIHWEDIIVLVVKLSETLVIPCFVWLEKACLIFEFPPFLHDIIGDDSLDEARHRARFLISHRPVKFALDISCDFTD